MKKPHAVMMNKKNDFRPFEDETTIEKLSKKMDASLFLFGSHSKKRPNNIVIGMLFACEIWVNLLILYVNIPHRMKYTRNII